MTSNRFRKPTDGLTQKNKSAGSLSRACETDQVNLWEITNHEDARYRISIPSAVQNFRIALQYAADRAYPPGDPLTAPSRKRFHLDPDKGLGV
jgi:hypothetical protein